PRARDYHRPMDTGPAFLDSRDFGRIARAIRFIDANFRAQPRLAAIAASAHLSEFHFNRLFRRWAGVTPRQYLAYVTARAARAALAGTPSVLEAAYCVGLSGPSRLHDLMVTLEAVTPGELKARGRGMQITYGITDTPLGRVPRRCGAGRATPETRREGHELSAQGLAGAARARQRRTNHVRGARARGGQPRCRPGGGQGRRRQPGGMAHSLPQRAASGR